MDQDGQAACRRAGLCLVGGRGAKEGPMNAQVAKPPVTPASGARTLSVYVLLADGSTVEIRPAAGGDFDAVLRMHRAMSPENIYFRFFSLSPAAAEGEANRICRPAAPDHAVLLAWLAGELVGAASYEATGSSGAAEIAFAVADHAHHRGIATLLLEHLVSAARNSGIRTFTADVLAENAAMLKVFAAAGLRVRRSQADGVTELAFDLPAGGADPPPWWPPGPRRPAGRGSATCFRTASTLST
jgi:GNAT superfamily N-acetyltransferase